MRPEAVQLANGTARDNVLDGTVADVSFLGSVIRLRVDLGQGSTVHVDTFNDQRTPPPNRAAPVKVTLAGSDILVLGD
jgi:putative spermidine/putrescine transport system ATP-binding protein